MPGWCMALPLPPPLHCLLSLFLFVCLSFSSRTLRPPPPSPAPAMTPHDRLHARHEGTEVHCITVGATVITCTRIHRPFQVHHRYATMDAALHHEELLDLEQQVEALLLDMDVPHQQTAAGVGSSSGGGGGRGDVSSSSARAAAFAKAQDILRRLSRLLQHLRVEIRLLDDEERDVYEAHASEHARRIASLRSWAQQRKENAVKRTAAAVSLAQGQHSTGSSGIHFRAVEGGAGILWSPHEGGNDDPDRGDDSATSNRTEAHQTAARISEVQHRILQSLGHSEKLLNETETLGNEAATTLLVQTEQIKRTNAELDEMRSELELVSVELKSFMRRMARDRLIIFFVITIVVCIIVIVVLAVLKHKWR
ncbi:putative Qa-SNARE protein [Leishmania braziliensis MHOM/BR/75/M2904]|uniref:Qa-SNARE protein n=1 Tax=Leishmania braziliensis TaxID=5660 RepID=A4H8Y1_LEIBR|nr:putative Qa-SNARE protein [Leishmania braziliensis MHOM/BR/75/M2904]CAJ2470016.1 unnamed protein product [Leishmania braziliensis]CAJ2470523.1 unnamed protein product [Leishmania braziliensis]CAM37849.1 putative Qa-SNARE protein [Leishmania braziliensis MHOM/BR/75/M2904]